jgi:hypothetical protein
MLRLNVQKFSDLHLSLLDAAENIIEKRPGPETFVDKWFEIFWLLEKRPGLFVTLRFFDIEVEA